MIRWPGTLYVATAPVNLHASFDALVGFVRAPFSSTTWPRLGVHRMFGASGRPIRARSCWA